MVSRSRFDRFAGDHAGRLDDLFTATERRRRRPGSLAAAWALKEAALKSIGAITGWELDWREIEAIRLGREPAVRLAGKAAAVASERGIATIQVSLTHTESYYLATAVALSDADPNPDR